MRSFLSIPIKLYLWITLFTLYASPALASPESTCFGTTEKGHLQNGWQLPSSGANFEAYSPIGTTLGRNYVHSKVHATLLEAYKTLEHSAPNTHYVYGETGWAKGGSIRPHKTHQNGLSVDFFVPVLNAKGQSAKLPITLSNKLGYGIEFDSEGKFKEYRIDFDAMTEHLLALKQAADHQGIKIWRVIFDNTLQKHLFKTQKGAELKEQLTFSKKTPWVRHDEHYHMDFIVPCQR